MKNAPSVLAITFLLGVHLLGQTPTTSAPPAPKVIGPGLTYITYPIQPSQITSTRVDGYIPYEELLKQRPLQAPKVIYTLYKWTKPLDQNAIAIGYIKIEKPGTYAFLSSSGWDRNELIINGKVVCKFRDGEQKGQTVELPKGLLPIVSVGYENATEEVRVQWMPPGQTTGWTEIPKNLLFRGEVKTPPPAPAPKKPGAKK